jgi:hypothetical protein
MFLKIKLGLGSVIKAEIVQIIRFAKFYQRIYEMKFLEHELKRQKSKLKSRNY